MDEIIYTTPQEQVDKLLSQRMVIEDPEYAKEKLKLCGYSNLIKSYRDPYVFASDNKKIYRDGITFERIESLYILDKNLRNAVMSAMQELEEHVKEAAADVIASSFGVHQDDYLQFRNYRDKSKKKYQFTLTGIIKTMTKTLNTDKDPIAHYAKVHNIVPPWILFKSIYFSTIVNLVHQFKPNEQIKMVEHLYDVSAMKMPKEAIPQYMMTTLFTCLEYRNIAAHGGRIYNYAPKNATLIQEIDPSIRGFSILLLLLGALKYDAPFRILDQALHVELNRHCNEYPEDVTYLGHILNLDISSKEIAWVTSGSKKYHRNRNCSGILNPEKIDLSTAKDQGLIACKRCCK